MKSRNFVVWSAMTLAFALVCMLFVGLRSSAAGTNRYVASLGGANTGDCSLSPCITIQYAVNQSAAGDTINVAAGPYSEFVDIPATLTGLTLKGAQAGNSALGRTVGAGESLVETVNPSSNAPVFNVSASGVTIDGFAIRCNKITVAAIGIDVKNSGSGALITNDIFDSISSSDETAQAVYLEGGPDNVKIVANKTKQVVSPESAKGVFIGDSLSSDASENILVEGNLFAGISSSGRGAYGVLANNGASTAAAATGHTTIIIRGNTFDGLAGQWAHAIGLEGDTPNAQVMDNSISNVGAPTANRIAVFFQDNPSFSSGQVHNNNFDISGGYGIAVDTTLRDASGTAVGVLTGGPVDGTCNWWGSADGPGPIGPGSGALVSANVTYAPWLNAAAPGGACVGGFTTKKECEKFYEDQKKNFDKQREADNKAFEQQQKADKEAFEATPHTPAEKKTFHDQQEAAKKTFHDQQEADKKAFEQQNHDNKEQCKSLPK